jgi:hypothetical protein
MGYLRDLMHSEPVWKGEGAPPQHVIDYRRRHHAGQAEGFKEE